MHAVLFKIGPFAIRGYGLMLAIAFFVGIYMALRRSKRVGISSRNIVDLSVYIMISSILGARLFYVVSHWEEFSNRPLDIFNPFQSSGEFGIAGLVFYGGLLAATSVAIWYMRRHRMPVWKVTDVFAPSIALGIFFTRIGCFLNGCCFGTPADLLWGMVFPESSPAGYVFPHTPIHPAQLYSSLYGLAIFGLLLFLERFKRFDGFTFWVFVLLYAAARFSVDFVRYYEHSMTLFRVIDGPISVNQGISVGLFLLGWMMLFMLRRRAKSEK